MLLISGLIAACIRKDVIGRDVSRTTPIPTGLTATTTPTPPLPCPAFELTPTATVIASPIPPTIISPLNDTKLVVLNAYDRFPPGFDKSVIGIDQELILESVPAILQVAPISIGTRAWIDHNIAEMRACFSFDGPCTPQGAWIPFEASPDAVFLGGFRLSFKFQVDWIGERELWIGAEYRDALGNPILATGSDLDQAFSQGLQQFLQIRHSVVGVWDADTPLAAQPPIVQTLMAATQAASVITGSVDIGPGREIIGGSMGETIPMQVIFTANSPYGTISQMRTSGGCSVENMQGAEWEPFVEEKTYPIHVAINWTTFRVSVQYRDEMGNVSQIFCDELAVEGMPPTPKPIPTEWFDQIACIAGNEARPGPDEKVGCENVLFTWHQKNDLPDRISYQVNVYDAGNGAIIGSWTTREPFIAIPIPREYAGELIWTLSLYAEAYGLQLEHGQCSSLPTSLLSVEFPGIVNGIHFWYQP